MHRAHLRLQPLRTTIHERFHHFYHIVISYNSSFKNFILFLKSWIHFILAILEYHILLKLMKFYQKIWSLPKSTSLKILYQQLSYQLNLTNDKWRCSQEIYHKLLFFLLPLFLISKNLELIPHHIKTVLGLVFLLFFHIPYSSKQDNLFIWIENILNNKRVDN